MNRFVASVVSGFVVYGCSISQADSRARGESQLPVNVLNALTCLLKNRWYEDSLGLSPTGSIPLRYTVGQIPGTSGEEYAKKLSIVIYSKDRKRAVLLFATNSDKNKVLVISNSYDLVKGTQGWSAGEGQGGLGTYIAVGEFVDGLEKLPVYTILIENLPKHVACSWTP